MAGSARGGRLPGRVHSIFGAASAFLHRPPLRAADLALLAALAGAAAGLVGLARDSASPYRPAVDIDLSLAALPGYALLSLGRGLAAYALSLVFSLAYGTWAAKDRGAERVLIPLLDVLQSVPVLGFMPALVLTLAAAFPGSNAGLELAAVLLIFTGQVWNLTFAHYQAVRGVPAALSEVGNLYRFGAWRRFRWIELPCSASGLVWNSMLSMAGGWFFLMVSEAFVLGDRDFRLPGLGAYMSAAASKGDGRAVAAGVAAMALLVVALDQLLWRPLVAWAHRFRLDEGGEVAAPTSWFREVVRHSRTAAWLARRRREAFVRARARPPAAPRPPRARALGPALLLAGLLGALAWTASALIHLLSTVEAATWVSLAADAALTLARVLASVALGTLWALPAGLAIGLSPRLSRLLQPAVQVAASFPAPMLFPAVVALLHAAGVSLGVGSVLLMLLGTQWYVLFNVVAGAAAVPADLREAARLFRFTRGQRFWRLHLPAVFPHLVTGWVTAAGGAWNASIVSEWVTAGGEVMWTRGLGSAITGAAARGHFGTLAAAVVVMAIAVVAFNRLVWRRLHAFGERRFSLSG